MTKLDKKELATCRWLIRRLKAGYGARCKTSDLDDFKNIMALAVKNSTPKNNTIQKCVMSDERCGACRAKETIHFLEHHIELIKM